MVVSPSRAVPITAIAKASRQFADTFHEVESCLGPQSNDVDREGIMLKDGIETLPGKANPNLLLIAPHGYPDDDENTGVLVWSVQKILDCSAIINEVYRKPKLLQETPKQVYEKHSLEKRILNLNYKLQAEKLAYYIEQIQQSIKDPGSTIVVWIHGIDDRNIKNESKKLDLKERLHCLIGYGQPDHGTCNPELKDVLL